MSILILALIMAGTMIGAASHAVVVERRKQKFGSRNQGMRGHFDRDYRD